MEELKKLPLREKYRHIRILLTLMIVPGFVLLLAGGTVEAVMTNYGFKESLGGLINVVYFLGGTLGMLFLTHMMRKYTTRKILIYSSLTLSLSLLACAASPWYPVFLLFFFIAGIANGILIVFPGVYVANIFGEESAHGQNVLYGFFGLGVIISPIISGLIIDGGLSWRWAYVVPAVLIILLVPTLASSGLIDLGHVVTLSYRTVKRIASENKALFYGILLTVTLYIGAESSVSLWIIRYFDESFTRIILEPHWVLTSIWVGLTLGRFITGALSRRVKPYYLLLTMIATSTLLIIITPLLGSQEASLVLYPIIGLMFSGIYPTLVSYTAKFSPEYSGTVFTIVLAIGSAGGMVLPYLIGLISEFGNITAAMSAIGVPMLVILVLVVTIRPVLSDHKVVVSEVDNLQ